MMRRFFFFGPHFTCAAGVALEGGMWHRPLMVDDQFNFRSPSAQGSWMKDLLLLSGLILFLFTFFLSHRPFATPDEGRYVEIPREMVETGDFLTPHLNGLKYFEKPPLFYWMQAGLIRLFGIHEGVLRLWTTVLGLIGCLFVYGMGRFVVNRQAGLLAAGVLATSFLYFFLARLIILDMAVTVLITGALCSFWLSTVFTGKKGFLCLTFYGLFMALATLTKGLIGAVLPGMVILVWMGVMGQSRLLKRAFHPWVILLFLGVAAPWHILVSLKNPEFFDFYFIQEHLLRYTTSLHRRTQPFWFFIPVFLVGFFPWVSFFYGSLKNGWALSKTDPQFRSFFLFCLCWIGIVFLFFSFSQSKLIPYLLPIFPPAAFLVGCFLSHASFEDKQSRIFYQVFLFLVGFAALAYLPVKAFWWGSPLWESPVLGAFLGLVALISWGTCLYVQCYHLTLKAIFLSTIGLLMVGTLVDPLVQPRPSMKPFAQKLKELASPGDRVVIYGKYYQDLPVYLGRTVQVVNWSGELDFGARVDPTQDRMLSSESFWALWGGDAPVFLITPLETYAAFLKSQTPHLHFVFQDKKTVLLCNKPPFGR